MCRYLLGSALLFFSAFSDLVMAGDESIVCPADVLVEQKVSEDIPGWNSVQSRERLSLVRATFFLKGDMGETREDSESRVKGGGTIYHWEFSDSMEYEVACIYRGTNVRITRKLSADIASCDILVVRESGLNIQKYVRCRKKESAK